MIRIIRWIQPITRQIPSKHLHTPSKPPEFSRLWPLTGFIGTILVFLAYPEIDLWFSGLFFQAGHGFYLHDAWLVKWIYALFRDLPYLWIPLLIWLWVASWIWARHAEQRTRRFLLFLFLALAVGPGLLVNAILKGESGRARPHLIEQFGGEKTFTPPFTLADQCESNCSFVSGHASMGFYFIALAWTLGNARWLYYGIGIGAVVGFGRIVQGGHFLSDVIFSYFAVYLATLLCARWVLGHWHPRETEQQ